MELSTLRFQNRGFGLKLSPEFSLIQLIEISELNLASNSSLKFRYEFEPYFRIEEE